jgi:hypothetical protein
MAALDILALDIATPQVRVPSASDTYRLPRQALLIDGSNTAPSIAFSGATNRGFYRNGSLLVFADSNADIWWTAASSFALRNNAEFGFASATTSGGAMDVVLRRDAANTLALRNGTAAQEFRLYRNFTGASDFGYTGLRQDATTGFILDSVNLGSVGAPTNLLDVRSNGTQRVAVRPDGTSWWTGRLEVGGTNGNPLAIFGAGAVVLQVDGSIASTPGTAFATPDIRIRRGGVGIWEIDSGTTGAFRDLKLRSAIQVPPASLTFSNNGEWGVEMTSNTAGNLVYRGSDGTTRRCALVFV